MQKLESSLKNMVLVLVGVALIVGAVLAYINHLTSGPIAEKAAQSLATGIKSVMGTEDLQVAEPEEVKQEFGGKEFTFILHKCSDKSGKELGAAVESTTGGFGGDLKVLVGFDTEGKIMGYTILQASETPGLGAEIASTHFQGEFSGKKTLENGEVVLGVVKNGKVEKPDYQVDGISGGTITSVGVDAMLKACLSSYKNFLTNNNEEE